MQRFFSLVVTSVSLGLVLAVFLPSAAFAGGATIGSAAIPCIDSLRLSFSNIDSRRSITVTGPECFVGAGPNPTKQRPFGNSVRVAPETTEVRIVNCPGSPVPAFCTAKTNSRYRTRGALTAPTSGQQAELR
jgi:hypothetical protein